MLVKAESVPSGTSFNQISQLRLKNTIARPIVVQAEAGCPIVVRADSRRASRERALRTGSAELESEPGRNERHGHISGCADATK